MKGCVQWTPFTVASSGERTRSARLVGTELSGLLGSFLKELELPW